MEQYFHEGGMIVIEGMDSMRAIYVLAIWHSHRNRVASARGCVQLEAVQAIPQSSRWMPPDGSLTIQHSTLWWGRLLCTLPQLSSLGSLLLGL